MISRASTIGIFVSDQDRALQFYTETLGFELRQDIPMGPEARWIEVAPPGAETPFVLYTPPGMEDQIGGWSPVVMHCDDLGATHAELAERGVRFTQDPKEETWGMWAQFVDPDGNEFGLYEDPPREGGAAGVPSGAER